MTKMSTVTPMSRRNELFACIVSCTLFLSSGELQAQVVLAPPTPQVGSSNTVSADPPVPRPRTTPCTVQLFQNLAFADFNLKPFSYTPPRGCPASVRLSNRPGPHWGPNRSATESGGRAPAAPCAPASTRTR